MPLIRSLSQGCAIGPTQSVATQKGQHFTGSDLSQRVRQWHAVLASQPGSRWAVFHPDAFEFLSIVFALWSLQRTVCLPGDNRAGTVQRLQSRVDGFVGDFPDSVRLPEEVDADGCESVCVNPLSLDFPALEIYTSGSTGEPKAITKTIHQLEAELESIETLWPSMPNVVVLGTVSHQHLYGLTFRVLRPFCSGQAFERFTCEYWEDVYHKGKCYPLVSLISSPSHLSRLNPEILWDEWTQKWCQVISSAAPLAREDSLLARQILGVPVHEIYGSSETGAIAWRTQQPDEAEARWRALPQVELSATENGTLSVQSPYLMGQQPECLPDRVRFYPDDSFQLLGRTDRIVKVEGKRVSLTAFEHCLMALEWVKNAKALVLERRRVETAAVVELTECGADQLKTRGRKWMIKQLKKKLGEQFEPVVVPRRWRFVAQMPYNQQGKLTLDAMKDLFEENTHKWPTILSQETDGNQVIYQCQINHDLLYFDGHFAEHPILPGVVQVHWAEALGRQSLPIQGRFQRLEAIKFQRVIRPGGSVTLTLNFDAQKNKLSFQYESDSVIHSSGRICFG